MKKSRITLMTLLMLLAGAATVFADVADPTVTKPSFVIPVIIIAVAVIVIVLIIRRRKKK